MDNLKQHKEVFAHIAQVTHELDADKHWPLFLETWYAKDSIDKGVSHDDEAWESDCMTYCDDEAAEERMRIA